MKEIYQGPVIYSNVLLELRKHEVLALTPPYSTQKNVSKLNRQVRNDAKQIAYLKCRLERFNKDRMFLDQHLFSDTDVYLKAD